MASPLSIDLAIFSSANVTFSVSGLTGRAAFGTISISGVGESVDVEPIVGASGATKGFTPGTRNRSSISIVQTIDGWARMTDGIADNLLDGALLPTWTFSLFRGLGSSQIRSLNFSLERCRCTGFSTSTSYEDPDAIFVTSLWLPSRVVQPGKKLSVPTF